MFVEQARVEIFLRQWDLDSAKPGPTTHSDNENRMSNMKVRVGHRGFLTKVI